MSEPSKDFHELTAEEFQQVLAQIAVTAPVAVTLTLPAYRWESARL